MSFLDNLENNVNAIERQEEKDPEKRKRELERREMDRNAAVLRAPFADALRDSPFTSELMTECRTIGHRQRVLVRFSWIGENLRLDAGEKRMELTPTPEGIVATFLTNGAQSSRTKVDVEKDDPAVLAERWLGGS